MDFLLPTNDFVFKKIFGENQTILADFLASVLDLPKEEYRELTVINPDLELKFKDDKLGVLDIKVTLKSGKVINVEMQVRSQTSIWKRLNFYTAKMVVEQLKSGYAFDRINRVICILIADFVMIKENGVYHNRFRLMDEKTGARYPDSPEINTLELPKLSEADGTVLGDWLKFFRARTEEDFMKAAENNTAINEAWGMIKVLSGDEQARALAESREKYEHDMASWLSDARQEGLDEGRQEGRQEERLDVARNLMGMGLPIDAIMAATSLTREEIENIRS